MDLKYFWDIFVQHIYLTEWTPHPVSIRWFRYLVGGVMSGNIIQELYIYVCVYVDISIIGDK